MPPGTTEEKEEKIEDPMENEEENIRVYHFVQSRWRVTTKLTSSDIAVIIDPTQTNIFIWEGRHSPSRIREHAKSALITLKLQHPQHTFLPMKRSKTYRKHQEIPENILSTLQLALKL